MEVGGLQVAKNHLHLLSSQPTVTQTDHFPLAHCAGHTGDTFLGKICSQFMDTGDHIEFLNSWTSEIPCSMEQSPSLRKRAPVDLRLLLQILSERYLSYPSLFRPTRLHQGRPLGWGKDRVAKSQRVEPLRKIKIMSHLTLSFSATLKEGWQLSPLPLLWDQDKIGPAL